MPISDTETLCATPPVSVRSVVGLGLLRVNRWWGRRRDRRCVPPSTPKEIPPISANSLPCPTFRTGDGVGSRQSGVAGTPASSKPLNGSALPVMNAATLGDRSQRCPIALLSTQAGDVELRIPKLRRGLFLPGDPRAAPADRSGLVRGGDGPPCAVSLPVRSTTWSGDGCGDSISNRGVADLCRTRRDRRRVPHPHAQAHQFPYVYLDATYLNVRNGTGQSGVDGRVIVASGTDGARMRRFWRGFLTSLKGAASVVSGW